MPIHLSLAPDTHAPKIGEGAEDSSHKYQTCTDNGPASTSWKSDLTKSQSENRPERSSLPPSTSPPKGQPTTSRPMKHYSIHRPWSEARNAERGHSMKPAECSPMTRWEQESAQEEPWNSVSRFNAEDHRGVPGLRGRSNDLTLKHDSCVGVEPTANSDRTSSEVENYQGNVCEAGDWSGVVGVGAWLK